MFDPYSLVLSAMIGIALLAIFAVLAYTVITFKKMDEKILKQRQDIDKLIRYIQFFDKLIFDMTKYIDGNKANFDKIMQISTKQVSSLMDLDEFKSLDPVLKDKYKKYVVDKMAVSIMDILNKSKGEPYFTDEQIQKYINDYISKFSPNITKYVPPTNSTLPLVDNEMTIISK